MGNKVFINKDHLIETVYVGVQTASTIRQIAHRTAELAKKLQQQERPVLILVDLRQLHHVTLDGRATASRVLGEIPYQGIAVYGATIFLKHLINLIARATDRRNKIQTFSSRESAVQWLKQLVKPAPQL